MPSKKKTNQTEKQENGVETETYSLESGAIVEVSFKEYSADGKMADVEKNPKSATIFLPGWSMSAGDKSTEGLSQALRRNERTFSISTRMENNKNKNLDVLLEEARAIKKFIAEQGLEEVTLIGHSRGGSKSINLAYLLQKDEIVKVKGVVLLDSVGLYQQTPAQLTARFTADAPIGVAKDVLTAGTALKASKDIIANLSKEIARSGFNYPGRLKEEIKEMAQINSRATEINTPVIIVSGVGDLVSSPAKITPIEKVEKVLERRETEESQGRLSSRGEVAKETIFKSSPYVIVVAPEGSHSLPLSHRAEQIARVTKKLITRAQSRLDKSERKVA